MELRSAEAILLDVVDLHDYDRIVTFLTREWGKKRGVAKGARRKHSRFGGQLQPLARVSVEWMEKDNRDLVRISSVELQRSARHLQEDLEGLLLSAYLADHIQEFVQENEASDLFFRLLDSTVQALIEGVDRGLATRYFEAWVLRLAGVFPAPEICPQCERALVASGAALLASGESLVCRDCAGKQGRAQAVSAQAVEFLSRIDRVKLVDLDRNRPAGSTLDEVERICTLVRRSFLQHELKSYSVIRETMSGLPSIPAPPSESN
jgi:DNA repair protein RecO (recombination protein O)